MPITSRSLALALLPAAAAFSAPAVHVPRASSTAAAQPLLAARPVALRITQPPLAVATTPPELEEKQLIYEQIRANVGEVRQQLRRGDNFSYNLAMQCRASGHLFLKIADRLQADHLRALNAEAAENTYDTHDLRGPLGRMMTAPDTWPGSRVEHDSRSARP